MVPDKVQGAKCHGRYFHPNTEVALCPSDIPYADSVGKVGC